MQSENLTSKQQVRIAKQNGKEYGKVNQDEDIEKENKELHEQP